MGKSSTLTVPSAITYGASSTSALTSAFSYLSSLTKTAAGDYNLTFNSFMLADILSFMETSRC